MNVTTPMATTGGTVRGLGMTSTLAAILEMGAGVAVDKTPKGFEYDPGVSPVTLSADWSRVMRLLILASLAVVGSVGNVFMISAVMVEDHLKKRGNAFLVNVALADLLVTGLVMPASAIVILAGHEDSPVICRFEWTLEAICFLVTVLTLATIAIENYARLCFPPDRYAVLTPSRVTATTLAMWAVAGIAIGLQSFFDLGPDFCERRFNNGIAIAQVIGACILVGLPVFVTIFAYMGLVIRVRRAISGSYKPPIAFAWDYSLTKTNMCSFALFAVFWLPFGGALCVSAVRPVKTGIFYYLAWFGFSKSCFNNLLYCVADRHFRNAYIKLFHYCCCKTTESLSVAKKSVRRFNDIPKRNVYK